MTTASRSTGAQRSQKRKRSESVAGSTGGDLSLSNLNFDKKNADLKRLPQDTTISRRPLQHPPVANLYAGSSVPKVVYVSKNTPIMAAVKRVRKLLQQVEKRAMKNVKLVDGHGGDKDKLARLAEGSKLSKEEKVYVKATGMAMKQALNVGQWFREKEKEMAVDVEVKTGSVVVVDDIVERHPGTSVNMDKGNGEKDNARLGSENLEVVAEPVSLDSAEQPLEAQPVSQSSALEMRNGEARPEAEGTEHSSAANAANTSIKATRSRASRRRKKRPMYDPEELPEARTRWVKMVEIAISLKG